MKRFRVWNHLSSSLWLVPVLCVLAGVGLSFATIAIDHAAGSLVPDWLSGDPEAALAVLTTVAASMVTLTGLVLTITMVVVQLATGQFTPRVLRTILRDRPSQFAIGTFVATFAHAMLVMREVKQPTAQNPAGSVPGVAIVVAFVLILVSIVVLVFYVNHIGQSLRASSLIDSVGDDTRDLLVELYPKEPVPEPRDRELPDGAPRQIVVAPQPGVLFMVGEAELVRIAEAGGAVIVLRPRIGDFVPEGAPVLAVYGNRSLDDSELLDALAFGKDRTLHRDVAYGIRMLVDVAVRALSPASGDPTTAVQAIDRIHDCLRLLATRPLPSGRHYDDAGRLRLVVPALSWEGFVHIAVDELRHFAPQSIQATRRLAAMLQDLISVAPENRRPPLHHQLSLLEIGARNAFAETGEDEWAMEPDQQGVGSGARELLQR